MLEPFGAALSQWLGADGAERWLQVVSAAPSSNRCFLELHPGSRTRCDIVTRVQASDGSLDAWLARPAPASAVFAETLALLRTWLAQLRAGKGCLRSGCFLLWLEFDLDIGRADLGDPSIFIGLTPGTSVGALSAELGDYPHLQAACAEFDRLIHGPTRVFDEVMRPNSLTLGHIGYMAARQEGSRRSPLRSCWRCDDIEHVFAILEAADIPFDRKTLARETAWLGRDDVHVNSLMLHLDSSARFAADFSLEVNVFAPDDDSPGKRQEAVLRSLVERRLMSSEQAQLMSGLRTPVATGGETTCRSDLHHFKLRLVRSRVAAAKCYWLVHREE